MGIRSGTTHKKRQKELARQDRQREKIAKRAQRKLEKQAALAGGETASPQDEPVAGDDTATGA